MRKIILLSVFIVLIFSCKQNKIIPEKDMVLLLSKIQLIDASVQHHSYRNKFFQKDTIDYYSKTIESFGYTKEQFDSSLNYYARRPKDFDAIYDKVIVELSKIETENLKIYRELTDSINRDTVINYWPCKKEYFISEDKSVDNLKFSLPVVGLGTYTLSADVRIFSDDSTMNPAMECYFFFDDKSTEGNRSSYTKAIYSKGQDTINYSLSIDLENSLVTHFKGNLYCRFNSDKVKQHAIFNNIKIHYTPRNPKAKDRKKNRKESLKRFI